MVSAGRALTLGLLLFFAGCPGDGDSTISEEDAQLFLELSARGEVYVGEARVVTRCSPTLTPAEAYPGIAAEAEWRPKIDAWEMISLAGSAASTDVGGTLLLANGKGDQPTEASTVFFSVAPYDGPTAPGLDALWECGDINVAAGVVRRVLYFLEVSNFEGTLHSSLEEAMDEVSDLRSTTTQMTATQESFLRPDGVADAIVGPVDWPPPDFGALVQGVGD